MNRFSISGSGKLRTILERLSMRYFSFSLWLDSMYLKSFYSWFRDSSSCCMKSFSFWRPVEPPSPRDSTSCWFFERLLLDKMLGVPLSGFSILGGSVKL